MIDRRHLLGAALAWRPWRRMRPRALAQNKDCSGDDGKPTQTWRLPSEIVLDLPGVSRPARRRPTPSSTSSSTTIAPGAKSRRPISTGSSPATGISACASSRIRSCRSAACRRPRSFSPCSPSRATRRPMRSTGRCSAHRGQVSGEDALAEISRAKLDRATVEKHADSDDIRIALRKHAATSRALGMEATPSFAMNGMGVGGWPGAGRSRA